MKWIKKYETFKNTKDNSLNEEFIGKLLKNLFNKAKQNISMSYSKNFGTADKANKIISEYQTKAIEAQKQKLIPLKALAEYIKSVKAGGEKDDNKLKSLDTNYKKQEDLYIKQLSKLKEIYDAKLQDVIEDEKNKKINNYIKIKKLEMEESLLLNEIKLIQQEVGMTDEQIQDDETFKLIWSNLNKRTQDNEQKQKEEEKILNSKEDETNGEETFDFQEAKSNEDYRGPLKDDKFLVGDEIKIYVRSSENKDVPTLEEQGEDYNGTTAFVYPQGEDKSKIRVAYKSGASESEIFEIDKGRVITTKKIDEEKPKEEKPKEENTNSEQL